MYYLLKYLNLLQNSVKQIITTNVFINLFIIQYIIEKMKKLKQILNLGI